MHFSHHKLARRPEKLPIRHGRGRSLLLLGLVLTAAPLWAQTFYLASGRPDGIALLAPPPVSGSAEAAADLASAKAVFEGRTTNQEAHAFKSAGLAFELFAPAIGPEFNLADLPKTRALLARVKQEIGSAIDTPKDFWKRTRPYALDPRLSLGKPEQSFSYPSGHSTRGTVYALVLAELFPARREAILAVGCEIGWDRVLIGKHFPTDVYAGRVLGKAIVRELLASQSFQKDLAEARRESQAAAGKTVETTR